ncbi:MAG: O-antigen ligase family protein [Burkholderiales bacterium]|nr:O-antigen ligase family protein [Burkholderiales bacterium]
MSLAARERAWLLAGWVAAAMGASIPVSVATDNALLGLLVALWLIGGGLRRSWQAVREHRAAQIALGLFALLGLGVLYADAPLGERLSYLSKYRELALLAVLLPVFAEADVRRRGLVVLCAVVSLAVLLSYLLRLGLVPSGVPGEGLFKGVSGDAYVFKLRITYSFLAAFAAYVMAAGALRAPRTWQKVILGLWALACALNVLLLVQGRTGYLVLGALVVYGTVVRLGPKGAIAGAALAAAMGVAAFYGSSAFHARIAQTLQELRQGAGDEATATSTGLRLQFLRNSVAIIRDHPLTGVGTGGFATAYAEKVRGTAQVQTTNPHSEYLLLGAQIGLAGPLLLLALFWALWRAHARLPKCSLEREIGQAMVVAMALGCVFNSFLLDHTEGLVFAWVSALALGASLNRDTTPASAIPAAGESAAAVVPAEAGIQPAVDPARPGFPLSRE